MPTKTELIYDIIKGQGLLYEIAKTHTQGKPAQLYGVALEMFVANWHHYEFRDDDTRSASVIAREFMEFVFNDGPMPATVRGDYPA